MKARRLLIALANVLLSASVGVCAWEAYHAEVQAAARDAARQHGAEVVASSAGFLRFPGTEGIYFVAGMYLVAALVFVGLGLAARHRPDWLTLPMKAAFTALSPEQRVTVVTTVQDYLLVVSTLCVALVTFVTWHALGAATGAWPVPFHGDSREAALAALTVVLAFLVTTTLLFFREYRQRVAEYLSTERETEETRSDPV